MMPFATPVQSMFRATPPLSAPVQATVATGEHSFYSASTSDPSHVVDGNYVHNHSHAQAQAHLQLAQAMEPAYYHNAHLAPTAARSTSTGHWTGHGHSHAQYGGPYDQQPSHSQIYQYSVPDQLYQPPPAQPDKPEDLVPLLFEDLAGLESCGLMNHFDQLWLHSQTVGQLPPVLEQMHLGVVRIEAFQALMSLIHRIRDYRQQSLTQPQRTGSYSHYHPQQRSNGGVDVYNHGVSTTIMASPGSRHSTPAPTAVSEHSHSHSHSHHDLHQHHQHQHSTTVPPSHHGQPQLDNGEPQWMEKERFCKPSRLITIYSSKPFLMTPVHIQRQYITSKKVIESMNDSDRLALSTINVRWMGVAAEDQMFLVATDVCALINIRKSNTAKAVSAFSSSVNCLEKASMPVSCYHNGKGSSTHILTVLSLSGVKRLLTSSRAVLASAVLNYLLTVAQQLMRQPNFVPFNDPTKPTVMPHVTGSSIGTSSSRSPTPHSLTSPSQSPPLPVVATPVSSISSPSTALASLSVSVKTERADDELSYSSPTAGSSAGSPTGSLRAKNPRSNSVDYDTERPVKKERVSPKSSEAAPTTTVTRSDSGQHPLRQIIELDEPFHDDSHSFLHARLAHSPAVTQPRVTMSPLTSQPWTGADLDLALTLPNLAPQSP